MLWMSVKSGSMLAGVRGFTRPCVAAYQMPRPPTTTAMATLTMAVRLKIHAELEALEKQTNVTIQMKASSMAREAKTGRSAPRSIPMVGGNMRASEAIHSGKLTQ